MKKVLFSLAIVALLGSCRKEDIKPCPGPVTPTYSDTKYFLTNSSGNGEADTINLIQLPGYEFQMTCLLKSFGGVSNIDISGPELTVHYRANSAHTKFFQGSGMFGDKELYIQWESENIDSTNVHGFYSVYSKCRTN